MPVVNMHNIMYGSSLSINSPVTISSLKTPKYKKLTTSGNDPQISSKMKYANYAKNNAQFYKYPILDLKIPATGTADQVQNASVNTNYINQNVTQAPSFTKIYCISYTSNYGQSN